MTEQTIKAGEVFIHCDHLRRKTQHWWKADPPVKAIRLTDGEMVEATWFVVCDRCFKKGHGTLKLVQPLLKKHDVWGEDFSLMFTNEGR